MVKENVSPEERLFNAIEKNDGAAPEPGTLKKAAPDFKELLFKLKRHIASFAIKKGETEKKPFFDIIGNLKIINRILVVASAALAVFLITDVIMANRNHNNIFAETYGVESLQFQKKLITPLKALSFYEEAAAKRDLFSPPARGSEAQLPGAQPKFTELTKNLVLVGIYWGTHPEAMIEDTAAKKTYFLKRGDPINGLRIKNILKDRVILEYQGEETEFM